MATTWEKMLESDDLPPPESPDDSFNLEDYDEMHTGDENDSEYFEFLSSARKLPSAQWGIASSRDPAMEPEWF